MNIEGRGQGNTGIGTMEMRNALTMEEHGMQSETGALSLLRLHLRSIRHPVPVLALYYEILYNIRFIRDFGARVSACRYNKQHGHHNLGCQSSCHQDPSFHLRATFHHGSRASGATASSLSKVPPSFQ